MSGVASSGTFVMEYIPPIIRPMVISPISALFFIEKDIILFSSVTKTGKNEIYDEIGKYIS